MYNPVQGFILDFSFFLFFFWGGGGGGVDVSVDENIKHINFGIHAPCKLLLAS